MSYALGNWAALCRYTEDGDLSIDNNAVERMLKLIALEEKTGCSPAANGGKATAAVLFTLVSSAKRHHLDTWAYFSMQLLRHGHGWCSPNAHGAIRRAVAAWKESNHE